MYFYKIAGALLLIVSAVAGSFLMNSIVSKRLAQTDAIIAFFRFIKAQIECFSLPATEIIIRCDKRLHDECGLYYSSPPNNLPELFEAFEIKDSRVYDIVSRFAESFGRGYRDEQIKECDYYISLLCDRRQEMAAELPKKKKLNSTMCISSALFAVILLL